MEQPFSMLRSETNVKNLREHTGDFFEMSEEGSSVKTWRLIFLCLKFYLCNWNSPQKTKSIHRILDMGCEKAGYEQWKCEKLRHKCVQVWGKSFNLSCISGERCHSYSISFCSKSPWGCLSNGKLRVPILPSSNKYIWKYHNLSVCKGLSHFDWVLCMQWKPLV